MKKEKQGQEHTERVKIPSDSAVLRGTLTIPVGPGQIVLFAHGSGSSWLSLRNTYVAEALQ